jgi:hypothetical protein
MMASLTFDGDEVQYFVPHYSVKLVQRVKAPCHLSPGFEDRTCRAGQGRLNSCCFATHPAREIHRCLYCKSTVWSCLQVPAHDRRNCKLLMPRDVQYQTRSLR